MSITEYKGDNPTIKRLEKSVDDFVSEVFRLNSAENPNTTSIKPAQFVKCYKSIESAPDSALTNDCVSSPSTHWGSYFRHCVKELTADEMIETTSRLFLSSMKLARATMNNYESVIDAENLEKQYAKCKEELDRHRVTVIELQQTVINAQKDQLTSLTSSVQKVKAYSTVLAQNCAATSPKVRNPPTPHHPTPLRQPGKQKKPDCFWSPRNYR